MKIIIVFLFLFLSAFTVGQAQTTPDSIFAYELNGYYYVGQSFKKGVIITTTQYETQDTSVVMDLLSRRVNNQVEDLALKVNDIWDRSEVITVVVDANTSLFNLFGVSIFDISADAVAESYTGNWQISEDGGENYFNALISFEPTPTMTVGPQSFSLRFLGSSWLKILGYNGDNELYRLYNAGRVEYRSLDQSLILYKQ